MSIKLQKRLNGPKEQRELMEEVSKIDDEKFSTMSVKIPKKLHMEFKGLVSFKGDQVKDTVIELLQSYIKDNRI